MRLGLEKRARAIDIECKAAGRGLDLIHLVDEVGDREIHFQRTPKRVADVHGSPCRDDLTLPTGILVWCGPYRETIGIVRWSDVFQAIRDIDLRRKEVLHANRRIVTAGASGPDEEDRCRIEVLSCNLSREALKKHRKDIVQ